MTGRHKVLTVFVAAVLPAAAGCGVFGTELAETREALAQAKVELAEARANLAAKEAELGEVDANAGKLALELAVVRTAATKDRTQLEDQLRKAQAAADKARGQRKGETAELQKAVDRLRGSADFLKRKWQEAAAKAAQLEKENSALRKPTTAPQK